MKLARKKEKEESEPLTLEESGEIYFADYMSGSVKKDGKHHIAADLRHGNPIFAPYSSRRSLAPDLFAYIESVARYIPIRDEIAIDFLIEKEDKDLENRLRTQFVGYYAFAINQKKMERRRDNRIIFFLFVIGIAFIGLYGLLAYFTSDLGLSAGLLGIWTAILSQIVSIASWVFIWEACDRLFLEKPAETRELLRLTQMASAEIAFIYEGDAEARKEVLQ